jgi:small subunit ribosomal protein S16
MAAKIKLTRMGMKKQPTYRVVIQEEHSKRDGRFIENLGYYNPRTDPPTIVMNQERVNYWLGVGALPTDSVGRLLKTAGISEKYSKMRVSNKPAPTATAAIEDRGETVGTPPGEVTSASTEITEGTEKPVSVSSDEPADG